MDRLLLYFTVKNQNRKSTQENKPSRIMCQKLFSFFGFMWRSFNWAKICEERVQNPRMVQNRNASSCIKWEEQKCWNPPLTSPRAFITKLCFYLHKMHLHLKTLWARSFGKMKKIGLYMCCVCDAWVVKVPSSVAIQDSCCSLLTCSNDRCRI